MGEISALGLGYSWNCLDILHRRLGFQVVCSLLELHVIYEP